MTLHDWNSNWDYSSLLDSYYSWDYWGWCSDLCLMRRRRKKKEEEEAADWYRLISYYSMCSLCASKAHNLLEGFILNQMYITITKQTLVIGMHCYIHVCTMYMHCTHLICSLCCYVFFSVLFSDHSIFTPEWFTLQIPYWGIQLHAVSNEYYSIHPPQCWRNYSAAVNTHHDYEYMNIYMNVDVYKCIYGYVCIVEHI